MFKQSLEDLKANGGNYVSLIIPYYQTNKYATDIRRGWNTQTDDSLVAAIEYVHSIGISVALKIHLESDDGSSIFIPATTTNQLFPCGNGCADKLPLGDYSVSVTNSGGTSNPGYLTFKGITTSSFSARSNTSVKPNTKNVKLGSITISPGIPIKLKSLTLFSTSTSIVLLQS